MRVYFIVSLFFYKTEYCFFSSFLYDFLFSSVLQQAGRNPSQATLSKYWSPGTSKLNFDDFCEILKCERQTEEAELMRAFKTMDVNGDGYIFHSALEKALTTVSDVKHMKFSFILMQQTRIISKADGTSFYSMYVHEKVNELR